MNEENATSNSNRTNKLPFIPILKISKRDSKRNKRSIQTFFKKFRTSKEHKETYEEIASLIDTKFKQCLDGNDLTTRKYLSLGLITRISDIYFGTMAEMINNRATTATILLRQQIENVAVAYKLANDISYTKNLLLGSRHDKNYRLLNIMELIKNANGKHPHIEETYNALSNYLHPNSESIYQNFMAISDKKKKFRVSPIGQGFKHKKESEGFVSSLEKLTLSALLEINNYLNNN